jgi:hypothetical protein
MKRLLVFLLAFSLVTWPSQVSANQPTVAIIDVGFNPSLFPNNVVYEVCIVSNAACPNGTRFQEGPGSAAATSLPAFAHGTNMLSILTTVNPDAKVILIRILGLNTNGRVGGYTIDDITAALRWVVNNSSRLNIKAVSISQGRVNAPCRATPELTGAISSLKQQDVTVIASTGNDKNRTNMAVPACIDDVVSVGATDNPAEGTNGAAWNPTASPTIALYSNGSASTDFYTNGRFYYTAQDGTRQFSVGTSNATAAFAGWWMKNLGSTSTQTYESISQKTSLTSNAWLKGKYVLIP